MDLATLGLRPDEATRFEPFGQQAQAIAGGPQHFERIAPSASDTNTSPPNGLSSSTDWTLAARPWNPPRLCGAPHKRCYAELPVMRRRDELLSGKLGRSLFRELDYFT